jgi:hypothetical protein
LLRYRDRGPGFRGQGSGIGGREFCTLG